MCFHGAGITIDPDQNVPRLPRTRWRECTSSASSAGLPRSASAAGGDPTAKAAITKNFKTFAS